MGEQEEKQNLYALLIGVDFYLPNKLYGSLKGAVRDVDRVEEFLRQKMGVPAERIRKLVSRRQPEATDRKPTYENIVASFKDLTAEARPNDQVYIHYSGHGGRVKTAYPDLKGPGELDEALVPMDIGTSRYLLDLELAHLLQQMVEKQLIVTIVLDSCHSGGATRGFDSDVRGTDEIGEPRPFPSQVATDQELQATWQALAGGNARGLKKPGSGWLPGSQGYVLLAACRPSEYANEYDVRPGERVGALTYWMLDVLSRVGPNFTYKMLHDQVMPRIHSRFPQQSPQLQGAADRVFLGMHAVPQPPAVNVLDVAGTRVQLNAGLVQMVRKGAQFAVYPAGTVDWAELDKRLALVEVKEVAATSSWAEVSYTFDGRTVAVGDQAVLLNPGNVQLRRAVHLRGKDWPAASEQAAALDRVKAALEQEGKGWIVLAGADDETCYQVAVTADGAYEILDPSGQPVPNLRPEIAIGDDNAAGRVVQRLVQLAKYQNILVLDNPDDTSPLVRALEVELGQPQAGFDPGADRPQFRPLQEAGDAPILPPDQWVVLRVKNSSSQVVNMAVLDLQPDWGVSKFFPPPGESSEPLDPGAERLIPLQTFLDTGYDDATDVLKVFVALDPLDLTWLQLDALDRPSTRGGRKAPLAGTLEALWEAFTEDAPRTRQVNVFASPSRGWASAQVEVHVKKAPRG